MSRTQTNLPKNPKARRRFVNKKPRVPYCIGCGHTFKHIKDLFNHRNTERCGGRFLPQEERLLWEKKTHFENLFNATCISEYRRKADYAFTQANLLRKKRLAQ